MMTLEQKKVYLFILNKEAVTKQVLYKEIPELTEGKINKVLDILSDGAFIKTEMVFNELNGQYTKVYKSPLASDIVCEF